MPTAGTGSRRGSAGHTYSEIPETDLRHAAAAHAAQQGWSYQRDTYGDGNGMGGYSALVAPYDAPPQVQDVPPEVCR